MKIPFYEQETNYTCGPAALRMILGAFGHNYSEAELAEKLGAVPKIGIDNDRLVEVAEELGLTTVASLDMTYEQLRELVAGEGLVIVNYIEPTDDVGHFSVVTKIDDQQITLHDPWSGPDFKMERADFEERWHDMAGKFSRWAVVLKPTASH